MNAISGIVAQETENAPHPAAEAPAPSVREIPGREALARAVATAALVAADAAGFALAWLLVEQAMGFEDTAARLAALLAGLALFAGAALGLCPGYRLHPHERRRRRLTSLARAVLLTAAAGLLLAPDHRWIAVLAVFAALSLALQAVLQPLARRALRAAGLWGERVALIAGPNQREPLRRHFEENWQYGIRPVSPDAGGPRPRTALVASDDVPLSERLATLRRSYREVIMLADLPTMRISGLQPADLDGLIGVRLTAARGDGDTGIRRAVDLAICLPALLAAVPVIAVAAAAICAADPGSPFYRQTRKGVGERDFGVLKLRTMYRDADERLERLLATNPAAAAEWRAHFKLRDDPRVLPGIGRFLRATSIDELPQLLNVVVGDMHLVGPRPFPAYHLAAMAPEFREKRGAVVPGLTGLWQVSERSEADLERQQKLDEFYIDNRSLWLDWQIIASTFSAVLRRSGV